MRDYKKEAEREKKICKRLTIKLDKNKAEEFLKKLNGKEYSVWIKEKIEEFLNI